MSHKRQFLEVPGDLLERVDPIFYSEPLAAALESNWDGMNGISERLTPKSWGGKVTN